MYSSSKIFILFLLLSFTSCAGDVGTFNPQPSFNTISVFDGNPATRPTPGFTEVALGPVASLSESSSGNAAKNLAADENLVSIQEVRMYLQDVTLLDEQGNEALKLIGPFVVRLVELGVVVDESFPAFGGGVVPNGNYPELQLSFAQLDDPSLIPEQLLADPLTTEGLIQHSIVIDGTVEFSNLAQPNSSIVPFRFLSQKEEVISLTTPNPIVLDGNFTTLFIAFKIQEWFGNDIHTLLSKVDPSQLSDSPLILQEESEVSSLSTLAQRTEDDINNSIRIAPSTDELFDEAEIDELSSSEPIQPAL